jgi:hypothetical protein
MLVVNPPIAVALDRTHVSSIMLTFKSLGLGLACAIIRLHSYLPGQIMFKCYVRWLSRRSTSIRFYEENF